MKEYTYTNKDYLGVKEGVVPPTPQYLWINSKDNKLYKFGNNGWVSISGAEFSVMGEYDKEKTYYPNSIVTYNGSSYISLISVPTYEYPTQNSDYWNLLAQKGEQGPQGNSGYSGNIDELEVVNNLIDGGENSALSAEQGKILKEELNECAKLIEVTQIIEENTLSSLDETSNKPVSGKGIAEAIKGAGFATQKEFTELSAEIGGIEAQAELAMMSFPFGNKDGLTRNGRKKGMPSSYANTGFLIVSIGSQFRVYDSSQYDVAGLAFFNEEREFLGVCETGVEGHQTITLAEDNIIEGAVYCVATALLSNGSASGYYANIPVGNTIAEQLNFIEKTASPKNIAREVTGIISSEVIQSNRSDISIYFDNVPQEDRYFIRVDVDEPQLDSYDLYFSSTDHSIKVKQFTDLKWGVLYEVRRDAEMPSLYIINTDYPYSSSYFKITYYSPADIKRVMREVVGWEGKTIVAFGDSITEKRGDDKKTYCDYIAEMTGANVYNLGISGTRLSQRAEPSETPASYTEAYAALDIVNMIKACSNQDFTKQINAAAYLTETQNDNNETIIARMQSIDWSKVDAVIVFGGTNDWTAEAQIGEASSEASNTILGATKLIVKTLLTAYPHVKLYWFTPIIRWASPRDEASWSDNLTHGRVTLKQLSSNIEEVVKSLHIPCCDTYNTLGWNMYNFDAYFTASDGTHPSYGYDEIARKIVAFINANRTF